MIKDKGLSPELNQKIHYTLRIATAMCFIGHGSFGIITKPIWCNYFAVFGIGHDTAYQLMPIVGCIDIALGIMMLACPLRVIPAWLVVWGIATALLRPLSGEPFAEFIERAGNFGAPLALLVLSGIPNNIRGWLAPIRPAIKPGKETYTTLTTCLRIAAFLLFVGHGWLNVIEKKGLMDQYTAIGFSDPVQAAHAIGIAEIVAAFIVLIKPFRSLVFILFLWKMASEVFYPHYKIFEWVERGGSYGVLLALWFITERKNVLAWPVTKLAIK
jgi:uncharacterized membrane protein YphA (DoxX/SURF4 family)